MATPVPVVSETRTKTKTKVRFVNYILSGTCINCSVSFSLISLFWKEEEVASIFKRKKDLLYEIFPSIL